MSQFKLVSDLVPRGDQPAAIEGISRGILAGRRHQVLLGVTGSGKTFTMAHIIARARKPSLVLAPNKTLAAQLYAEFRSLFPENAVEYFVSYYDYYQPEAYLPATDTYIQKDSSINEMIDKLRHSATRSVLTRRDVIVVASVSCIFGLGAPEDYLGMRVELETGEEKGRERLLAELVAMHYDRNDIDFHRGTFRVRGDRVEIFPAYEEDRAVRVDFFGDQIDAIAEIDPLKGAVTRKLQRATVFPASHYVTQKQTLKRAVVSIIAELKDRIAFFRDEARWIEAQRIEERTQFDLEMMQELGYCNGIENYSRHLTGREAGEPPPTLLDYFPRDFLVFIDESHIAVPQLQGMYNGDRSRKETLVSYGFRLPSALDNRPMTFGEWEGVVAQAIYASATPGPYELEKVRGVFENRQAEGEKLPLAVQVDFRGRLKGFQASQADVDGRRNALLGGVIAERQSFQERPQAGRDEPADHFPPRHAPKVRRAHRVPGHPLLFLVEADDDAGDHPPGTEIDRLHGAAARRHDAHVRVPPVLDQGCPEGDPLARFHQEPRLQVGHPPGQQRHPLRPGQGVQRRGRFPGDPGRVSLFDAEVFHGRFFKCPGRSRAGELKSVVFYHLCRRLSTAELKAAAPAGPLRPGPSAPAVYKSIF